MNVQHVVNELNDKLFNSTYNEHDYFVYLECVESPVGTYVKFADHYLWDSENDYREWIDEEEQEPLSEYLVKEVEKVLEVLTLSVKALKEGSDGSIC